MFFLAAVKYEASRARFLAVSRTCYTRRCCVIIPSLWWRLSKYWWITAQRMCTNRMLRMLVTHIDKIYRLSIRLLAFHLYNVSSLCSAPLPFSHDVFFSIHAWDFNLGRITWVVGSFEWIINLSWKVKLWLRWAESALLTYEGYFSSRAVMSSCLMQA